MTFCIPWKHALGRLTKYNYNEVISLCV
jgi:hypothetical protein